MVARVRTFGDREEAIAAADAMVGWPQAHVADIPLGAYCIIGHSAECQCGRCPVYMTNGFFE